MSSEDQNTIKENKISEIRKKKNANGKDDKENDRGAGPHTETLQKRPKQENSLSIWERGGGRLLEPGVLLEARRRETAHQKNHTNKIPASAAHRDR